MKKNNLKEGTLLLSIPLIEDERFDKTVIIITKTTEKEKIGFIINKKTNTKLYQLIPQINDKKIITYCGGPVSKDNLFFFHKNKSIEKCQKISKDIYFGGNFNQIVEYINCNLISANEIFFCLGYCGWGKNQLEREIKEKSWIIINEKIDFVSDNVNWKRKIIDFDKKYKLWANSNRNFHLN